MAAQLLRQSLNQLRHFFCQQAGYQILATRSGYLINQSQRHGEIHTIVALARHKMISQCIANIVHHQLRWELVGGDACCLVTHQIVTLEI